MKNTNFPALTKILGRSSNFPLRMVLAFTVDDIEKQIREVEKSIQGMEVALAKNTGKSQFPNPYQKNMTDIKKRIEVVITLLNKIFNMNV